jgi:hypothetical protein
MLWLISRHVSIRLEVSIDRPAERLSLAKCPRPSAPIVHDLSVSSPNQDSMGLLLRQTRSRERHELTVAREPHARTRAEPIRKGPFRVPREVGVYQLSGPALGPLKPPPVNTTTPAAPLGPNWRSPEFVPPNAPIPASWVFP